MDKMERKQFFFFILVLFLILILAPSFIEAMGSRVRKPEYNLLLITIDTLRADHLGCYGYQEVKTPIIDGLASEGVLFTHAFTPVPITLPSHVTILTGLYPMQHGIRNNGNFILRPEVLTLAELMKAQGFRTCACVGAFVLDSLFGLDQGFDLYDDSLPKEGSSVSLLDNERSAEAVTHSALDWLEKNSDAPFFLWLHYFDPHAVYLPPSPFKEEYKGNLYDGEIAYTDQCIGDLFQGMRKLGIMDNTIIIVTADHGEGLGEHGEPTHAIFIYDSTMHVPLIIHTPREILPAGKIEAMVTTLDIFPTIIDLFAFSSEEISQARIQGKSLLPLIMGKLDSLHTEILFESLYPELNFGWSRIEGIRTPEWKYVKAPKPELYHLVNDPKEEKNLYSKEVIMWQDKLDAMKITLGHEKEFSVGLDESVKERLQSLGYVWSDAAEGAVERPDPKDMVHIMEGIDRGVSYIYLGLYDQARKEFQKILSFNPENSSALFYLASVEEKKGNLEEAEKVFKQLLSVSPNYLDVHNHLGVIYHKQGDLDKALNEFELALEQAEYSEVYYNLSVAYRQKNYHDKAIHAAQKALDLDPQYADAYNQLGQLAFDREELDKALGYFQQAIKINPSHLEAHNNIGIIYHRQGYEDDAIKALEKALSIDPNSAEAYNNIGSIYLTNGLYDRAEEAFKKAIHIKPNYLEAIINLGSVFFHQNDYNEAMGYYLRATGMMPENQEPWRHLGILFLAQGEHAEAYRALEKACQIGPESPDLYFYMGQAVYGLRRFDEALNLWKKAIAINPDYRQVYQKLGELFYDLGMVQEALTAWEKSYDLDPKDPLPLLNIATVKFQRGQYSEAISLWKKALSIDPSLEEPYLHIGTAYLRQNDPDMATHVWEKLLARNPDHIDALINMGTARYEKRDIEGAIALWEKAEKLDAENPKIHYNLGLAFFSIKDYPRSISELKEALRLQPDNSDVLLLWQQAKSLCSDPCE